MCEHVLPTRIWLIYWPELHNAHENSVSAASLNLDPTWDESVLATKTFRLLPNQVEQGAVFWQDVSFLSAIGASIGKTACKKPTITNGCVEGETVTQALDKLSPDKRASIDSLIVRSAYMTPIGIEVRIRIVRLPENVKL